MYWRRPRTTGAVPGPHRAHSAVLLYNKLYIFGGGDGGNYYDHLYVLDTRTHSSVDIYLTIYRRDDALD